MRKEDLEEDVDTAEGEDGVLAVGVVHGEVDQRRRGRDSAARSAQHMRVLVDDPQESGDEALLLQKADTKVEVKSAEIPEDSKCVMKKRFLHPILLNHPTNVWNKQLKGGQERRRKIFFCGSRVREEGFNLIFFHLLE